SKGGRAMNIEVRQPVRGAKDSGKTRVGIFDCDIHPKSSLEDLRPYLSNRWWDYLQTYGQRQRHGYVKGFPYPKSQPLASRRDSWPPGGGLPGPRSSSPMRTAKCPARRFASARAIAASPTFCS